MSLAQWDAPPPECPACTIRLQQQFVPVAIGGSNRSKAESVVESIIAEDYHAADIQKEHRPQGTPKVRYKEPTSSSSTWGAAQQALEHAISLGRQSRLKHGSGLDVLQANLKSGAETDLIEASKKRAIRVY